MNRRLIAALGPILGCAVQACEPYPGSGTSSGSSGGEGGASSSSSATGRQALDAPSYCARLIACGQALELHECIRTFGPIRVTPACKNGIAGATCAVLAAANSTLLSTCFPRCSGVIGACNGDGTLTECTVAGTSQVIDCQASCVAQGFAGWTGACGASYQGRVSDRAQCWCQ